MPSISKDARKFLAELKAEGWAYDGYTRNCRIRVQHQPTGLTRTISQTPSDHRTWKNERGKLRRAVAAHEQARREGEPACADNA